MEKRNKKKKEADQCVGGPQSKHRVLSPDLDYYWNIISGSWQILSLKNLQHPLPAKLVSTAKVNQHANASILLNKKEALDFYWMSEEKRNNNDRSLKGSDIWMFGLFFHLDSWGCLQFKHGPRARLQRCPSPSGSLITVTWTWEVMWDSVPQITSSWIWPEGEDSAGQTWLVLSAKPGINSHQLCQGEEDWPEQG